MPGEPVTLTVTIENSPENEYGFDINQIDLVGRDVVSKGSDFGILGPGDSTTVSITTTFDSPGVKRFSLQVGGQSTGGVGGTTVKKPVTIVVDDAEPLIDTSYQNLLVGVENDFSVSVSNGRLTPIRSVNVTVAGEEVSLKEPTKSRGTIAEGTAAQFNFSLTSSSVGQRTVEIDVSFTRNGVARTLTERRTVVFKALGEDVTTLSNVTQSPLRVAPGRPVTVSFVVTNRGGSPIHDATFDVLLNGSSLQAGSSGTNRYIEELPGDTGRRVTFQLKASEQASSGIATVPLTYTVTTDDGRTVTTRTTISVEILGDPTLHAFVRKVQDRGERTRLTIDVANVGDGIAKAASIRIGNASYYLGEIQAGEFETATLAVAPADRYDAVVTYKNAFDERSAETEQVDVSELRPPESGIPLLWVAAVALVIVVAGVLLWRIRR